MNRFSKKLAALCLDAGMNESTLANAAGISQKSAVNYLTGHSMPRPDILRRIACIFGVTCEYLTNDATDDRECGRAVEVRAETVRRLKGSVAAGKAARFMRRNLDYFAGMDIDEERFLDAMLCAFMQNCAA